MDSLRVQKRMGGGFFIPLIFLAARLGTLAIRGFRVARLARAAMAGRRIASVATKVKRLSSGARSSLKTVRYVAKRSVKKHVKKQVKKQVKKKAKDHLKDEIQNQIEGGINGGKPVSSRPATVKNVKRSIKQNKRSKSSSTQSRKRVKKFRHTLMPKSSTNRHRSLRNHMKWAERRSVLERSKRS